MKVARSVGVTEDAIKDQVASMIATLCGNLTGHAKPTEFTRDDRFPAGAVQISERTGSAAEPKFHFFG